MLPNINQLIFISLDNGENYSLKARVADINQWKLAIELPIDKDSGRLKIIPPSSKIKVWYAFDDQGQFTFETEVTELIKGKVPLLILKLPQKFERLQRRDYLRVSASLETAIKLSVSKEGKSSWRVVRTIDISGGGMQFLLPYYELKPNQNINGWIAIPYKNGSIEHVNFEGKVIRVSQPNPDSKIYLISIQFITIHENLREKIIRFCYEKQVEINRKIHKLN